MEPAAKTDQNKIKVGDYLSEIQYYEVIGVKREFIRVRNERGLEFNVSQDIVGEGMYSANQYNEEQKVTKTDLAEIFTNVKDSIFTINFLKQASKKGISEKLKALDGNLPSTNRSLQDLAGQLLVGEERTLIGYKISSEGYLGRSMVVDLSLPAGKNIRQVDHRHINWLIHQNIRYTLA